MQDGKLESNIFGVTTQSQLFAVLWKHSIGRRTDNSFAYCSLRPKHAYGAFKMSLFHAICYVRMYWNRRKIRKQLNCRIVFEFSGDSNTCWRSKWHGKVIKRQTHMKNLSIYLFSCSCKKFPVSFLLSYFLRSVCCLRHCVVFARWCYYSCSSLVWRDERSLCAWDIIRVNLLHPFMCHRFYAAFKPTAEPRKIQRKLIPPRKFTKKKNQKEIARKIVAKWNEMKRSSNNRFARANERTTAISIQQGSCSYRIAFNSVLVLFYYCLSLVALFSAKWKSSGRRLSLVFRFRRCTKYRKNHY